MPPQDPLHRGDDDDRKAGRDRGDAEAAACTDDDDPRPAGERERFDDGRALRRSQARVLAIQRRRSSFLVEFGNMDGPPQIAMLMILLAIGLGSTIGVVPAIMGDRFARIRHGYDGEAHCGSFEIAEEKPEACFAGGADAQAAASISNLWNNGLTFLTGSLTGSLSDEHGRKGPLLIGLVFCMMPAGLLCALQEVPGMNPWWYYGTSASTGLISWVSIALSALNDVLPQELRAPGIGLFLASLLLGMCISPSLALFISREALTKVSFGVVLLGIALTVCFVPETVRPRDGAAAAKRRKDREAKQLERDRRLSAAEDVGSASAFRRFYYGSPVCRIFRGLIVRPFLELSILNRDSFFRLLGLLAFFTGMVNAGDQVLLIYYLEDQLGFDAEDVSVMFLIIGACGIFVQVAVMNPLNTAVGEKMVLVISFAAGVVTNLLYGTALKKSTVFAAIVVSSLSTMAFATVSAVKANNVGGSEQGRIQGALYSVKALASGTGPALMQVVYSKTKSAPRTLFGGPGTMFVAASGLFVIAIGLALALPNERANSDPRHGGNPLPPDEVQEEDAASVPMLAIDEDAIGEYRRLVADDSDDEAASDGSYGST
mmetsp:Transcript_14496/g.33747  ORF Transcript_14496/g.33747 Transcript_14496/m.33747 type:complete len:601 (+) Transcript_14496:224-2026(+)